MSTLKEIIQEYDSREQLSRNTANSEACVREIADMRHLGIAPQHYTAVTHCRYCGSVPLWPGVSEKVQGCPWCFNRHKGLPIPRPDQCEAVETE